MRVFFYLVVTIYLACVSANAQVFNYSVSVDTSNVYTPLVNDSVLTLDSAWKHTYKVNMGFSFPYAGSNFSELSIEKNNYISFDSERKFSILAFAGYSCKRDEQSHYSVLSYASTGAAPNRVLKVQFSKVGQNDLSAEQLNYQLWFHENGRIDVVTGSHSYPVADSLTSNDTINCVQIGLINTNMDASDRGLFLSGSASNPSSQPVNSSLPDFSFMRSFPRIGTRYSFIPN